MSNATTTLTTSYIGGAVTSIATNPPISDATNSVLPSNDQTVQAIIFGVLATVLALAAVVVGYLQLRKFRRTQDEETALNLIPVDPAILQ